MDKSVTMELQQKGKTQTQKPLTSYSIKTKIESWFLENASIACILLRSNGSAMFVVFLNQITDLFLHILYFSNWMESKPIVWDSSCSITVNFD